MSPATLLARLDHRLAHLAAGPRDLPERQQTLRNALDWSYELLPAEAQRVFRGPAVRAGGCTIEAAATLCAADREDSFAVERQLETLMGGSLLSPINRGARETRFAMLETGRDYGLERLATCGEGTAVRERHLAWCLALGEEAFATAWATGRARSHEETLAEALALVARAP
jgi:predicted ATPase